MISDMKPGRYRMRNGDTVTVEDSDGNCLDPWRGLDDRGVRYSWAEGGIWFECGEPASFDLVEYLGPAVTTPPLASNGRPNSQYLTQTGPTEPSIQGASLTAVGVGPCEVAQSETESAAVRLSGEPR